MAFLLSRTEEQYLGRLVEFVAFDASHFFILTHFFIPRHVIIPLSLQGEMPELLNTDRNFNLSYKRR